MWSQRNADKHDGNPAQRTPRAAFQRIASVYNKARESSLFRFTSDFKHQIATIKTPSAPALATSTEEYTRTNATDINICAAAATPSGQDTPGCTTSPVAFERGVETPEPASEPLWFRLPAEIREEIYAYAFTNQTIHIHREFLSEDEAKKGADMAVFENNGQSYSVGYTVCCAKDTDADAYSRTTLPDDPDQDQDLAVAHWQDRHNDCRRNSPHRQLDLAVGLLRSCRQIYREAAHLLYCANTFSFESPSDMNFFIQTVILPHRRKDVQRIWVHAEHVFSSSPFVGVSQETADMLKGLEFLGLTIGYYKLTGLRPSMPIFPALGTAEVVIGPKKQGAAVNAALKNRELAREMEVDLLE